MPKPSDASAAKPDLLMVSPEAPFPMVGGGATRTASLIEFLARRYHVDLILFAEAGAPDPAIQIPPGTVRQVWTICLPRHSRTLPARISRNFVRYVRWMPPLMDRFQGFESEMAGLIEGRCYQTALIEHFWCARYLHVLQAHSDEVWLDLHNVESVWHERLAASEKGPARTALRRFAHACRAQERELLPRFSGILVPSDNDAAGIAPAVGDTPAVVYPNALPRVDPLPRGDDDAIIFTGNLEYPPNVRAVEWFFRQVWPALRDSHPGLVWRIVGKNPHSIPRHIRNSARVEVIGPVENAIAELAIAKVAVVPLLAGSGTRFKILEAWAAGTPVVSTAIGAEGLGAEHQRNILIADDPSDMSETIAGLLQSGERRAAIGAAGRERYWECFTWDVAWRALESSSFCGNRTLY